VVCGIVFTVAYILLIPGLHCLLFSAKASMFGMTFVDLEKSTLTSIKLLMEEGRYPAAFTILICSVIAPFVKLAILLVCVYCIQVRGNAGPKVSSAIAFVRCISKWATVDAFTASILVAFFCNSPILQVSLHKGFYCFVGYCIFSVAGALLLEQPVQQRRPNVDAGLAGKSMVPAVVGSALLLTLLVALSYMPLFDVECSELALKEQLSFVAIIQRLAKHGSTIAALVCLTFVGIFPAADLVMSVVEATTGHAQHQVGGWLRDFAMLDVFALAAIVTMNAASGIRKSLTVSLLPGGWLLITWAVLWMIYSLGFRQTIAAYTIPSKDKHAVGTFENAMDYEKQALLGESQEIKEC